jgi:ABC-2 type transport system ATP-binding protein
LIHVAGLTKSYGPVRALEDVSFDVGEGEVLGFLGPNGAGKSTTLRILTGFLPADGGTVVVAGHDVRTDSLAARAVTGYLPESVPLYPELRVTEYLRFRSRLKRVPRRERRAAIGRALEAAGVAGVAGQIIGTLSRGYRQRVGLADALLGDPRILILDEPTVGLDPEQVRQFRTLLRELGKRLTIILSTHILSEVEQVATRVTIIVKGRIAAQDTADNLRRRLGAGDRIRLEVACPAGGRPRPDEVAREIARLPGVEGVRDAEAGDPGTTEVGGESPAGGDRAEPETGGKSFAAFLVRPRAGSDPREAIFRLVRDRGWTLRELSRRDLSLEEIFHEIIAGGGPGARGAKGKAAGRPAGEDRT